VYDILPDVVLACWFALAATWLIGALRASRHRPRSKESRDIASGAGALGGLLIIESPAAMWTSVTTGALWVRAGGIPILLAATAITIWARWSLGDAWSSSARIADAPELRVDGPYALTRHPIYSGVLAMLLASSLVYGLGRWLAATIVVGITLLVKMRAEESILARRFPQQYACYRARVPRLVPRPVRRRG
jgi:protein-S-isoprenylcysteine O-methyltransferase Ste14